MRRKNEADSRIRRGSITTWATVLLTLVLAISALPVRAQEPFPVSLVTGRTAPTRNPEPGVIRSQRVALRVDALAGPVPGGLPNPQGKEWLRLRVFDDVDLVLELTERKPVARGGFSWVGRPVDGTLGTAILLVRNGRVYGSYRGVGGVLTIWPTADGDHLVEERDDSRWIRDEPDFIPVELPEGKPAAESPAAVLAPIGHEVIDVLVVYTQELADHYGASDIDGLQANIDLAELNANTAYANSGVNQRIRIVHAQQIDYTESGSCDIDLPRLRDKNDGYLDDVHALRDLWGADLVSLWALDTGGCGKAYLMTSVSPSFESSGFSVGGGSPKSITFIHELGHNMGLRHDWYDDAGTTPFPYSHGYVEPTGAWVTLMAYASLCGAANLPGPCLPIYHFSNSAVLVDGAPTGVAPGTSTACQAGNTANPPCDADSQQSLDMSAPTVAGFRPTKVPARLRKEVDASFVRIGDTITYTLTVTNDSPVTASGVVLKDTVPAHTSLNSGSLSADASVAGAGGPGSLITWNTGVDLPSGDTLVRTFTVTATGGGFAVNTATLDAANTVHTLTSNRVVTGIWEKVACGFSDDFESPAARPLTGLAVGDRGLSHYWRTSTTEGGAPGWTIATPIPAPTAPSSTAGSLPGITSPRRSAPRMETRGSSARARRWNCMPTC